MTWACQLSVNVPVGLANESTEGTCHKLCIIPGGEAS